MKPVTVTPNIKPCSTVTVTSNVTPCLSYVLDIYEAYEDAWKSLDTELKYWIIAELFMRDHGAIDAYLILKELREEYAE